MEYLNDYNDNAKIMKIKFVFEVYVKSFFHENVNTNVDEKIFRHSLYHAYVLKLIIFYFNDIYTNYVMDTMRCSMLSFCGRDKYRINLRILNQIKQINAKP